MRRYTEQFIHVFGNETARKCEVKKHRRFSEIHRKSGGEIKCFVKNGDRGKENEMYYLKHKGKKVYIHEDNVFTKCPRCGQEIQVDLSEMVDENALDLYGTSVYCEKCSGKENAFGQNVTA